MFETGDFRMTNIARLVLLFVAAALSATMAMAAPNPDSIAITPQSPHALIVLKAELLPIPPTFRTSYRISLKRYDPAQQQMLGGPFAGAMFAATRGNFIDGYLVLEVDPGTYAFQDFSQQDFWALCFNDGSLQFTVRAGEVVYLGEMDVRRHAAELQRMAVMSGRTSLRNGRVAHFFDGVTPPTFLPADAADLPAAPPIVRPPTPRTTVAPRSVEFSPARFGTGHDLFGTGRICGGYYQGRAR
jgi:hypothetical protein